IGRESLIDGGIGLAERRGLEFALERIERPRPSVTLIFDEALENGNEGRSPIRPDMFDPAEQGGCVAEVHLGQKTPDLQLDADTPLQPPVEFEYQLVAEDQRTVALLAARPADVPCIDLAFLSEGFCCPKLEPFTISQGKRAFLPESLKHSSGKLRRSVRVVKQAQALAAPDPGDRIGLDRLFLGFFIDRERSKIGFGGAVPEFDIQKRKKKCLRAARSGERCHTADPDACDARGFIRKPASRRQKARRDRPFESLAFAPKKQ